MGEQGFAARAGPEEGAAERGTVGVHDLLRREQGSAQGTLREGAAVALGQGARSGPLAPAGPAELVDPAQGLGAQAAHGAMALHNTAVRLETTGALGMRKGQEERGDKRK